MPPLPAPPPAPPSNPIWRVLTAARDELQPRGALYWWDNADRQPETAWVVQITTTGQIVMDTDERSHAVTPGDIMLFRYGEASRYGQRQPLRHPYGCMWVTIQGAGLGEHLETLRQRYGPVFPGGNEPDLRQSLAAVVTAAAPRSGLSPTGIAETVFRLLMRLYEVADRELLAHLSPVDRAIARLVAEPLEPWSLKQLAAEHGVSREHLSRVFSQRHGVAPHTFLNDARRRRAIWMIQQTALPIKQVAEQSGYADTHTLARQVRAATGFSPTSLRNNHQRTTRPADVNTSTA